MSISGAMNNALSGLRATGRAAEVVSSNIANAMTPGYAVRTLSLSSQSRGDIGGVAINGITRSVDPLLISDRRMAASQYQNVAISNGFLSQFETLLGTPDTNGSLSAFLSDFENSLITATSRPDALDRLENVAAYARDLATGLNKISEGIQTERSRADSAIGTQVTRLNDALGEVRTLNVQIAANLSRGQDAAALQDLRQKTIDEIAEIVPVRVLDRDQGKVAIYSTGGAVLLDGTPAEIAFTTTNIVTPYQTLAGGTLSGLTINGNVIDTSTDRGPLRGGALAANFEVRDELGVDAQSQIDAFARDLIERFADPAVDPTLALGDAGLFTDGVGAFDPLDEVGISARIGVNPNADPAQGGEAWRIRDGLGAAAPGNAGDSTLLRALSETLSSSRVPASGSFGTGSYSAADLTAVMLSQVGTNRINADNRQAFASTQLDELKQTELSQGVDSDAELQRLILIEQAYAANARIIQAADEMLQSLLRF
jgi:flagellar hook-associated protein 1 FlgK